ncbi:MAG: hypothetical protein OSA98_22130, partial [Rubripirellula sp.]|nr:hypothetical protein [Rubripirellula sp.]
MNSGLKTEKREFHRLPEGKRHLRQHLDNRNSPKVMDMDLQLGRIGSAGLNRFQLARRPTTGGRPRDQCPVDDSGSEASWFADRGQPPAAALVHGTCPRHLSTALVHG